MACDRYKHAMSDAWRARVLRELRAVTSGSSSPLTDWNIASETSKRLMLVGLTLELLTRPEDRERYVSICVRDPGHEHRMEDVVARALRTILSDLGAIRGSTGLSSIVGCHPVYLARAFQHRLGLGVIDALNLVRVGALVWRASMTDVKIEALPIELGYATRGSMWRWCRRITGMTPGDWRRSVTKGVPTATSLETFDLATQLTVQDPIERRTPSTVRNIGDSRPRCRGMGRQPH